MPYFSSRLLPVILLCVALFCVQNGYAQQNKEDALEKAKRALKLMDEKQQYSEAVRLLQESQKLDPDNITFPYEIAYAYYAQGQYDKAIQQLLPLKEKTGTYARLYQLLGNSYDRNHQGEKAMNVYEEGLKKFPASAELYLELGNMMVKSENYNKALDYYEKGIKANPSFPSNYYWAAKIYCSSQEEVWGMLYGEIFMNMERNSKRTAEVSKMLYNVYKKEITFTSETSIGVSFSKNVITINDMADVKKMKLPFGSIYETLLLLSVTIEKGIDLNSMDRIRQRFISNYFTKDYANDYPNVLFDYQWKIKKAGHFEAYNHWLLMMGDENAFQQWQNTHKESWETFVKWFPVNGITIDKSHYFYSGQYNSGNK